MNKEMESIQLITSVSLPAHLLHIFLLALESTVHPSPSALWSRRLIKGLSCHLALTGPANGTRWQKTGRWAESEVWVGSSLYAATLSGFL